MRKDYTEELTYRTMETNYDYQSWETFSGVEFSFLISKKVVCQNSLNGVIFCCISDGQTHGMHSQTFENTEEGFNEAKQWVEKMRDEFANILL